MTQAWYNIVVIGTDLAGLMFAALAARSGYRVAVLGQGSRPNAYRRGGYVFLREPERFWGLSSSPVVSRMMTELSLGIEMKNRPEPLDPTLQIVLPDARLDVVGHRRRWERELDRELPGVTDELDAFEAWAREATRRSNDAVEADVALPPSGLRARSAYRKVAGDLDDLLSDGARDPVAAAISDPRGRALVRGTLAHLGGLGEGPRRPLTAGRLWTHLRAGLYRVPGGLDGLKALFIRKIREQSSDYRPDAVAAALAVKRGRVRAVELADRSEALGCELVVGNTDPRQILALVPRDQRHDAFHASLAALRPAGWRMTINLGLDPRVVPEGMGPEVVVIDPDDPTNGASALWLSRPGAGPGGEGRPGPGVIQVTAILPSRGAAPTLGGARRLVDRTLARVRQVVPWLDEHLEVVDAPALAPDPATGRPTLAPEALAPILEGAVAGTLGASPLAPGTAYKNLLLSGDLLFAGLGFEGTCLAALQTLRQTRQRVRLKTAIRADRGFNG